MEKNVYLLITDLHFDFVKANRNDYFGEILEIMTSVLKIRNKYKQEGYIVNALFMGDIFDGACTNSSDAMQAMEIFRYFCSEFDASYAVVGNHEITYAKDNPFWFLVSGIEDEGLVNIRRFIQPRGMNNTITIPDIITDGDVTIFFNHFGVKPKIPECSGVRIGVFHQNVGSNDICKMWGTFDNVEEASYIQGYNYVFFGHMHLAKGKYYLNKEHTCMGEWLGTLGRTKVTEVLDDSLEVNIPAITICDGKFTGVDDNYVTLQEYSQCVDKLKVEASQIGRKLVEEQKVKANLEYKGESLFDTLEVKLGETPLGFLLNFLNHSEAEVLYAYNSTLQSCGLENEGDGDNG